MTRQSVHEHIDAHLPEHIERIREYVRQPTISQTGEGIRDGVELLARYYRELGCAEVEIVETDGHPGIFAFYDAGAERTIVNYAMYDVQPADPSEWEHDPFEAVIAPAGPHPAAVYGRGAWFTKGPYRAFLNALESIIAVEGTLPVNILFIAEGEEEIASPHFAQIAERYRDRLSKADAALTLGGAQDASGRVSMFLGNKGFVYFDLVSSADGNGHGPLDAPVHDSLQGIVGTPAWRLVGALSTLVDGLSGEVLIKDFTENARPLSQADDELLHKLREQLSSGEFSRGFPNLAGEGRVTGFADGLSEIDALRRYAGEPTFNLNGIRGGYTGPGTVNFAVPTELIATIDCRLVPDMEPDEFLTKLRDHLDGHGYDDIEIRVNSQYTWAKTDVNEDVVQACIRAYEDMGAEVLVWPSKGTSGPWWVLNRLLGLPTVKEGGLGHGGGFHAPNEYFVIESDGSVAGLAECEKSHVDILYSFGKYPNEY